MCYHNDSPTDFRGHGQTILFNAVHVFYLLHKIRFHISVCKSLNKGTEFCLASAMIRASLTISDTSQFLLDNIADNSFFSSFVEILSAGSTQILLYPSVWSKNSAGVQKGKKRLLLLYAVGKPYHFLLCAFIRHANGKRNKSVVESKMDSSWSGANAKR